MKWFKCFLFLVPMFSINLQANQMLPFLKSMNEYLEPKGLKVQDYRPAMQNFSGFKLNFTVTNPDRAVEHETIQNIYINSDYNTAIIVYKKESIDEKMRDLDYVDLVDSFAKFFKRIEDKHYPNSPLFKNSHNIPYSDNLLEFHNAQRSFIINKDKTFVTSSKVLFFNGEELSDFSKDKIDGDQIEVRDLVKSIYESQEQITFIPENMDNMAVIFFSRALESSREIFKMRDKINNQKLGLLFLPYLALQDDMATSKDYQLFCQEDFSLTIELALMQDLSQDFSCKNTERETQRLLDIYKTRNEILDYYHLQFDKPYYYFYKEMKLIDYEYFKL